jgi:hypothetical protein
MVDPGDPRKPLLLDLPDDMLTEICSALPVRALTQFGSTCKYIRRISAQDSLWRNHLLSEWTETVPSKSAFEDYRQRTVMYGEWKTRLDVGLFNPINNFRLVFGAVAEPESFVPPPSLRYRELGFLYAVQRRSTVAARVALWHLLFLPFLLTIFARTLLASLAVLTAWGLCVLYLCVMPRGLQRLLPWWVLRLGMVTAVAYGVAGADDAVHIVLGHAHLALCGVLFAVALHMQRLLTRGWPLPPPSPANPASVTSARSGRRVLRCVRGVLHRNAVPADMMAAAAAVLLGLGGRRLLGELLYCVEVTLLLAALVLGRWADVLRFVVDLATGHLPFRLPSIALPSVLARVACLAAPSAVAAAVALSARRRGHSSLAVRAAGVFACSVFAGSLVLLAATGALVAVRVLSTQLVSPSVLLMLL